MSGGHFNYKQHEIRDIAEEIDEIIANNDITEKDRYGDPIGHGYSPEVIERFKEAVLTLRRATVMAQRVDWLVSGDDGPDSFMERWDEDLADLELSAAEINHESGRKLYTPNHEREYETQILKLNELVQSMEQNLAQLKEAARLKGVTLL